MRLVLVWVLCTAGVVALVLPGGYQMQWVGPAYILGAVWGYVVGRT